MLKNSWFLEFKELYDSDPSKMQKEYKDNDIEYMVRKYKISRSTIMKYCNEKKKSFIKVNAVLARKMRDEWISDKDICKEIWVNPSTLWMSIWPRKDKAEKSKRVWREFVEIRDLPKVRWENKEEKPYYDTSNIVEMWPIKALFSKINNYDSPRTTLS